jgi:hypothetical protein
VAEAWETEGGVRPSASWQAVTCVNTETAPKDTMRRPTLPGLGEGCHGSDIQNDRPIRFAGVVGDSMSTRSNGQHGKPLCGGWNIGSVDRRFGRLATGGVSEGFIVPLKTG